MCPAGTYGAQRKLFRNGPKQSTCLACPPGLFTALPGQTSCSRCPPNTFTAVNGSSICSACPRGTVAKAGAASPEACQACPEGSEPSTYRLGFCHTINKGEETEEHSSQREKLEQMLVPELLPELDAAEEGLTFSRRELGEHAHCQSPARGAQRPAAVTCLRSERAHLLAFF
eukprot:SM001672S02649  [mRNA]  locus=s1672:97:956:- [translate_table: standard]